MPFITDTPNSDTKPIADGDAEFQPRDIQRQYAACDRKRNASECQQAVAQRIEQAVEQGEDQHQCDRHDHLKARFRLLQFLELTRPFDAIAVGKLDIVGYTLLRFRDRAAEVASAHTELDWDETLVALVENVGRAGVEADRRELAQRDVSVATHCWRDATLILRHDAS